MTIDLGEWYRAARERIIAVASELDEEGGATAVAATPAWDVHDVVAHLSGIVDDATHGRMEGATTDPWTAAQVERGRGRTIPEMLDGWAEQAPLMESFLSSPAGAGSWRAVLDIHTHECDLLTALGRPIAVPIDVASWVAGMLRASFDESLVAAGLPAVTVEVDDVELFRSRLGRRTEAEVRGHGWSSDPTPYLDTWFVFGRAETSLGERAGTVSEGRAPDDPAAHP